MIPVKGGKEEAAVSLRSAIIQSQFKNIYVNA